MAGNQLGKTLAGAMETAIHATGRYPAWWQGKRFDTPTVSWVAGTTGETVRDTVQRMLIGRPGQEGTGAIPKDAIVELVPARGIADLLDGIKVRHVTGAISTIGLKSYLRGRESFQGETLDFLWFDEEPPVDVYFEALTRTNVSRGPIWLTFTPLTGVYSGEALPDGALARSSRHHHDDRRRGALQRRGTCTDHRVLSRT